MSVSSTIYSELRGKHSDFTERDVSSLKIVVVLKRHVSFGEVVVRRSACLLEAWEFLTSLHFTLHNSAEVPSSKDAVVGNPVVHGSRLVVVVVLEVWCIRVSEPERHESVSIINSIQVLTLHELLNVVLDDWNLMDDGSLGSGGVNADAITKSKNVLESLVLESIWVNINNTFGVSNSWI